MPNVIKLSTWLKGQTDTQGVYRIPSESVNIQLLCRSTFTGRAIIITIFHLVQEIGPFSLIQKNLKLGISSTDDKCHFAISWARSCRYHCVCKRLSKYSKRFKGAYLNCLKFTGCLAHRGSTLGFLLLQCSSGVVRHPRDLQVSVATRFC